MNRRAGSGRRLLAGWALGTLSASAFVVGPASATAPPGSPVEIDTPYGPVTIESVPTRVVTLSVDYLEALLALGVEPIAAPAAYDLGSWVTDVLPADSEVFTPELALGADIMEFIAALEPDLIVGDAYLITPEAFEDLSEVAPTVVHDDIAGDTETGSWQVLTQRLGDALGRSEEAATLIADTLDVVDAFRRDHAVSAGTSVAFAAPAGPDGSVVAAFDSDHSGLRFLQSLGFSIAPLGDDGEPFDGGRVMLSTENLAQLDSADVVIMGTFSTELQEQMRVNPLYQALAAVREGRVLELDTAHTAALNQPSALNIPALLELIEPFTTAG